MSETIAEGVRVQDRLLYFHNRIAGSGISFSQHNVIAVSLHDELFKGFPEADRQPFVDELITEEMAEKTPTPVEDWRPIAPKPPTDIMLRDRSTMRAVLLSVLEKPSKHVAEKVTYRYRQLAERDLIFALPFAGRLGNLSGVFDKRVIEKLGDLLGNDIVLDKLFLDDIDNYAHQPWAKDYAIRAVSNPTAWDGRNESFSLTQQPWFPEVRWMGQTILNSIAVLARDPSDNLGAMEVWKDMVQPYKEGYNPLYRMWIPPTHGLQSSDNSRQREDSVAEHLVRRGPPHDIIGYKFAVAGSGGGD